MVWTEPERLPVENTTAPSSVPLIEKDVASERDPLTKDSADSLAEEGADTIAPIPKAKKTTRKRLSAAPKPAPESDGMAVDESIGRKRVRR